ncbi:MAG TPA: hypothetical protein VJR89_11660 [Polyangiales bacterium]|nr:hypothetical protein [Polyangiales bacterium]
MLKQTRGAVCGVLLLIASCGGDDDGGVSSGLPPDEKLSALDGADAKKLCSSMAEGVNGVVSADDRERIACTVLAAPLSVTMSGSEIKGDVAKCKMLVDKCLSGDEISDEDPSFELPETFIDEKAECTESKASAKLESCDATVSEFESCADGLIGALQDQLAILDCETLKDPKKLLEGNDDEDNPLEIDKQPACKALVAKCPDIDFGGED